jgi:hypothetical protein
MTVLGAFPPRRFAQPDRQLRRVAHMPSAGSERRFVVVARLLFANLGVGIIDGLLNKMSAFAF